MGNVTYVKHTWTLGTLPSAVYLYRTSPITSWTQAFAKIKKRVKILSKYRSNKKYENSEVEMLLCKIVIKQFKHKSPQVTVLKIAVKVYISNAEFTDHTSRYKYESNSFD